MSYFSTNILDIQIRLLKNIQTQNALFKYLLLMSIQALNLSCSILLMSTSNFNYSVILFSQTTFTDIFWKLEAMMDLNKLLDPDTIFLKCLEYRRQKSNLWISPHPTETQRIWPRIKKF